MASMGSMPFAIEKTVNLSQDRRCCIPLFVHIRPRKSLTDLTFVCDNFNVARGGRVRGIKAIGEKRSGIHGGRDTTNDAPQVTFDKSRKNFAMQTDLQFSAASLNDLLDGDSLSKFQSIVSNDTFEKLENTHASISTDEADVPASDDIETPPLAGPNVMNVILVASECAPWSKTGGLGDVAGALPKALAQRGHRVMVVVPLYGNYAEPQDTGIRRRYKVGGEEILRRMVLFCKAAIEVPWYVPCGGVCYGDGNLVFIANDWHTALLPVYLKAYYRDNGLMQYTRSVLVIHNIAHQTADRIITVSHGYAWELKTSEGGWGLHNIITENDWKLKGIVNGIDTKDWNPKLDVHLTSDGYTNYSLDTLEIGKPQCKAALQKELGLPIRDDVPLIGFIGRLDAQKGVDLIAECVPWMMDQDVQLVMLGTGRPDLEQMLREMEKQHHERIRGWVGFSVKTAHRITAGADILLMPSRFEPCGLNQLYAKSYGTVPVVHAVGGLRDTVQPFDPFNESGLGWTFHRAEASELIHALGNCLLTYRKYKRSWVGIQRPGMMQDLSWGNAARNYEEVFVAAKYQW
ncbi:hypothetical protein L2E82_19379 [Cichorium intybus]|uniref:Uncharacterized protein n=1 Tax=Cichorium intybus TaxID=13427 RepID=A0ACB9FCC3_CICIN|nr:hypothetical protein L2E82_19379 [Cichorium intybus]